MAYLYNPSHFRNTDTPALHAFIGQYPLAMLTTHGPEGFSASHLPMLLAEDGGRTVLRGHIARANAHWKHIGEGAQALAVFSGPQAYVTPQWYPSKLKDGRVVPTWNYAVAHVRGTVRAVHDAGWLYDLVTALTNAHEKNFAHQWAVTDAPADYIEKMIGAIVGLEITVETIEGKFKLSQNRNDADYAGTQNGLAALNNPAADIMPKR
ncbi:MAG: FMN-binding negative transcriptional regulator [Rhodospirillaceae bacterium]|nr:FMN-binding negative transcriptional regulator [Rhodospirillaceae bacterium]